MSGDPRCLVCRGDGMVRVSGGESQPCACTHHPKRDLYEQPSEGWAGDALADIMRRAQARQAEAEEHARTCTARPCKRCEKFVCACGRPFDGAESRKCEVCFTTERLAKTLEPVRASVPKRFRWAFDATLETVRTRVKASDELISRALANPPTGDLTLYGDTAMGKTSLAVAMLDQWVRQAPEARGGARFTESWWLVGARARHPLGQGEAPEVREAIAAPLLVIDDLGSETDDGRGVMQFVIFSRHNAELPTWITTGFNPEQLMNRYGNQVIRRLVEHGKRVMLGAKS